MTTPTKRKARLLVVDDDPGLLRLLTIRLRAENYDVEAVESATAALAALTRVRPDLVITDLRMDQMDGIGLLKEVQSRAPGLRAPEPTHAGKKDLFGNYWVTTRSGNLFFIPAFFAVALLLSFNLLADALNDVLNPRTRNQ